MRLIDADHLLETLSQGCHSSIRKVIEREPTVVTEQTPLKPTDQEFIESYMVGKCTCGECVNSRMKYCDQCGQKLDWGGYYA